MKKGATNLVWLLLFLSHYYLHETNAFTCHPLLQHHVKHDNRSPMLCLKTLDKRNSNRKSSRPEDYACKQDLSDENDMAYSCSDGQVVSERSFGPEKLHTVMATMAKHLFVVLAISLSALFGCIELALAAETGGRFGGGGFPSSSQSTTSATNTQEEERYASLGDGPRPKVVITRKSDYPAYRKDPNYVPLSERERPGWSVSKTDIALVAGGGAYVLYSRTNRRKGGGRPDVVGAGPLITQLQVGLFCDRSTPSNTIEFFAGLGQQVDPSSQSSLGQAVQAACLELLRNEDIWVSAGSKLISYEDQDYQTCERDFNQLAVDERTKWKKDTFVNTPSTQVMSDERRMQRVSAGGPTFAVFTIILAWDSFPGGPNSKELLPESLQQGIQVKDRVTLKDILKLISSEATSSQSKNILSVEVLWTPERINDVLDRDEMVGKWPTLIDL